MKSNKYNGTEIWYGFYDIDGNGMEELLLATEDAQAIGGYRIADVFTYDMTGVQIKNIGKDIISSEDIATGQYNSVIYDTGIFRINKSDSEEFYNISADESYMEEFLDITPGSVSIMGLMNDTDNHVQLLMDKEVLEGESLGCHPCINTSSLKLKTKEVMEKFLPAVHHEAVIVELPRYEESKDEE